MLKKFDIIEIEEDPALGQKSSAIFLTYKPRWLCIDQQQLREESNFKIDDNLYRELKLFLFKHFEAQQIQNQENKDKQEEEAADLTSTEQMQKLWCSSISNALTKKNEQDKMKQYLNTKAVDAADLSLNKLALTDKALIK